MSLQQALERARQGSVEGGWTLLAGVRPDCEAAEQKLRRVAAETNDDLATFADGLATAHGGLVTLIGDLDRYTQTGALEQAIAATVADMSFDDAAFGTWLRDNCPGLAGDALDAADQITAAFEPQAHSNGRSAGV